MVELFDRFGAVSGSMLHFASMHSSRGCFTTNRDVPAFHVNSKIPNKILAAIFQGVSDVLSVENAKIPENNDNQIDS